jgi:pimeloyl-ACP methyl ester carboxylesterase
MPFTTANSKKLFYALTPPPPPTPPSGLTLLTIHGLGPTSTHFFPITAALAAAGHTVLSFDIDGCGRSPRSDPAADHTLRGIADDVLALIERFVDEGTITEKVVLVGHSMGGMIATEAAIKDGVGKGGRGRVVGVVEIGPPTVNPGVQKMMGGWVEQIIAGGESKSRHVPLLWKERC